jgi:hypothetical protein
MKRYAVRFAVSNLTMLVPQTSELTATSADFLQDVGPAGP